MSPKSANTRRYGFHLSISGGVRFAAEEAVRLGITAFQIFPGNPRGWEQKPIAPEDAEEFRKIVKTHGLGPILLHLPYLPNLASPDKAMYRKSVAVLKGAVEKAGLLEAEFVNAHAGNAMSGDRTGAIKLITEACDTALAADRTGKVQILIENSAGGGTEIGARFEDIAAILSSAKSKGRIQVCLDTAHAFGAGYDLRTPQAVKKTLAEFDHVIGLKHLKAVHFNDSMTAFASNHDRHQHLGKGEIGRTGLKALFLDKRLLKIPFIMETPKATESDDRMNLKTIRSFQ
jgi:deoxyribonuclease-4